MNINQTFERLDHIDLQLTNLTQTIDTLDENCAASEQTLTSMENKCSEIEVLVADIKDITSALINKIQQQEPTTGDDWTI